MRYALLRMRGRELGIPAWDENGRTELRRFTILQLSKRMSYLHLEHNLYNEPTLQDYNLHVMHAFPKKIILPETIRF